MLKSAFIQYWRHKDESDLKFGMLLMFPESIRNTTPSEKDVEMAVRNIVPSVIIDASSIKEELRDRAFPEIIRFLTDDVLIRFQRQEQRHYSLSFVISMLQQHVKEMMDSITMDEETILNIVTDRELLMDLGHLGSDQTESVARFLASYLLMSQILFLRLLYIGRPDIFTEPLSPISTHNS